MQAVLKDCVCIHMWTNMLAFLWDDDACLHVWESYEVTQGMRSTLNLIDISDLLVEVILQETVFFTHNHHSWLHADMLIDTKQEAISYHSIWSQVDSVTARSYSLLVYSNYHNTAVNHIKINEEDLYKK